MRSRILGEFMKYLVRLFPIAFLIAAFTNIAFAQYSSNLAEVEAYCLNHCSTFGRGVVDICKSRCRDNYYRPQPPTSLPSYSAPSPSRGSSASDVLDVLNTAIGLFQLMNQQSEPATEVESDSADEILQRLETERVEREREEEQERVEAVRLQEQRLKESAALKRKMEADRLASQPTPLPPAKNADDEFLDVTGKFRKENKVFIDHKAPTSTSAAQTSSIPRQTEAGSNLSARSYGADSINDPILVSNRDKSLERAMPRVLLRLAANTFELGRRMNNIGASLSAFKTALKAIDPMGEYDSAVAKVNPFKLEDDD